MGLFNFFGKSNTNSEPAKPKTLEVKTNNSSNAEKNNNSEDLKQKLKNTLYENLSSHKFTREEINEVFKIIDAAEADIQNLKKNLLQIKNSSENPTQAILKIKKEVEFIQQQMAADIKTKVRQIKLKKLNTKKERI